MCGHEQVQKKGIHLTAPGKMFESIGGPAAEGEAGSALKTVGRAPAVQPSASDGIPQGRRDLGGEDRDTRASFSHCYPDEDALVEECGPASGPTSTQKMFK